jgi:hypothetical protein
MRSNLTEMMTNPTFAPRLAAVFLVSMILSGPLMGEKSQHVADYETERWVPVELSFGSTSQVPNPYREVDFWAEFTREDGKVLRRPGFWDGDQRWVVRFAAAEGEWIYQTFVAGEETIGLAGQTGKVVVTAPSGLITGAHRGPLQMSRDGRNVLYADGTPFLMVADTPWALPFRGTVETVAHYAHTRRQQGFNAALLMTVQPDQRAEGPSDRLSPGSFGVGFHDLAQGRLNDINISYFQLLDELIGILRDQGIVPVFSPVFQGFGWKGLGSLGHSADPQEYARFFKYLIARYGASPAIWLVSADAAGRSPVVLPAGELVEEWDAYQQPAGLHYSPSDDYQPQWTDDPSHGFHYNRQHQTAIWLDFQWAQTGHNAEHKPEKVAAMFANQPPKAVANGEPTYESIGAPDKATGWWQGHEAWMNLTSGGTMGVVYGAGGLWNWKLFAEEPGWPDWANTSASWADALNFSGAQYVGYISRAFEGMPFTDMKPRPDLAEGLNLLAVSGEFYLCYLPDGGEVRIKGVPAGLQARWFDPKHGRFHPVETEQLTGIGYISPSEQPWVLVIGPHR